MVGAGADVRTGDAVTALTRDVSGTVTRVLPDCRPGWRSGPTGGSAVGEAEYLTTAPGRLAAWAYFEGVDQAGQLRLGKQGDYGFPAASCDSGQHIAALSLDINRGNEFRSRRGCSPPAD